MRDVSAAMMVIITRLLVPKPLLEVARVLMAAVRVRSERSSARTSEGGWMTGPKCCKQQGL